jgi:hypothetical protein
VSQNRKIWNAILGGSFLGQIANTYGIRFINKFGPAVARGIANNQLIQNAAPEVSAAITLMLNNPAALDRAGDKIARKITDAFNTYADRYCDESYDPILFWTCG